MPRLTVIMPSFNVAGYICACMDSVLSQTLEDMEILAIDAGSTDGTLELLQEYAAKDNRIKIINSGKKSYGYQLNRGIALASGEYVGIVETDDWISPDMYESLYAAAGDKGLDYVKGRGMFFVELKNGTRWERPVWHPVSREYMGRVISPCDMPELLATDNFLWNGIYRRDFLKNIRLNESPGAAFQDQGFLLQTISAAKKAVYLDKIVYYYRQDNSNSSIVNPNGFHFLVNEYSFMHPYLDGKENTWTGMYYLRMLKQCLGRFRNMAVKGAFWENAADDILWLKCQLEAAWSKGLLRKDMMSEKELFLFTLMRKDIHQAFAFLAEEFRIQAGRYAHLLNAAGNGKIVVSGCGETGKFVHALIAGRFSDKAAAFCDNSAQAQGSLIQGVRVISPQEAVRKYPQAAFVITSIKNAETMKEQLLSLGKEEALIHEYVPEKDMRLFLISFPGAGTDK